MYYEIYDTESRNVLIDTETLADALATVRATIRKHGPAAIATWMLVGDDETGTSVGDPIATGEALVRLAMQPQEITSQSHE